jgi:hypothetical protein
VVVVSIGTTVVVSIGAMVVVVSEVIVVVVSEDVVVSELLLHAVKTPAIAIIANNFFMRLKFFEVEYYRLRIHLFNRINFI